MQAGQDGCQHKGLEIPAALPGAGSNAQMHRMKSEAFMPYHMLQGAIWMLSQ